ncbi:MAG: DNA polymerase II [Candidatus Thermoplasmatota archaeon]|nr:DNA polymerase II [Candidatus Thermoplasmatota archaeon]
MYRMLVVSGHYRSEEASVIIELFGRLKDGRSATVIVSKFDPYFHVVEPNDRVRSELSADPMVRSLKDVELWHDGRMRRCIKVTIVFPFDVPKYRKRWQDAGFTVLAADIPFIFRYFYDLDLGVYIEVEGEEVSEHSYTTDICIRSSIVRRTSPFKVRLKVFSFDIENSIRTGELYMAGYSVGWFPLENDQTIESHSIVPPDDMDDPKEREDHIIEGLEKAIRENDPDILTGYNIDGYDIPHMIRRAKVLGIEGIKLGRDGSYVDDQGFRSWRARGRIIVDAWWQAKRTFRPKKETLEAVSNLLLGEGKDDIDTSIIEQEWELRREEVIRYCMKDAVLAMRILDRTQAIKKGIALAYVARLALIDVLNGTTSNLIDSILIREADRRGIGIPLTRHETKTSKIEGAYVHSIEPGLYHWVAVLDFRSMYPSIMIQNNICFTTLTDREEGTIHSPIPRVNYLTQDEKKGLVPDILRDLMRERQETKKQKRSAVNQEDREYYDGLQEAIKVLMNSFYGVFASFFYRFTDRSIGSSITAYARENIVTIIRTLKDEGKEVIYSDTDSIFIRSPFDDLDGTVQFGRSLAERFSEEDRVLEFEKVFRSFFTHGAKKRYVGMIAWPEEEMVVRGYEMRRTDSFDLQSRTLEDVFEMVLEGNTEGAIEHSRQMISRVKRGEVPVEDLVISRTIQEVEEEKIGTRYKNPDAMANVQALRKARKLGVEIVPGMKVSWVVVNARAKPQLVEPYIDGRDFEHVPDHDYYAERLSSTLARVTDVFGVSEKELLSGVQQSSLFDEFGEDDEKEEQAEEVENQPDKDDMESTMEAVRKEEAKNRSEKVSGLSTLDHWM